MAAKDLWLRLYTEITRDRKLRRHPASIRWTWITIMCMAKVSPVPGLLLLSESVPVTLEDIADEAALDLSEVKEAVAIFAAQDMLAEESGIYRLINWDERQFESDTSTDRVRRYREQQSKKNETDAKRFRNVSETAPETETETETENNLSSPNGDSSELFQNDEPVAEETPTKTVPYDRIVELYHQTCPSLPKVRQLTKKRRQLIRTRWTGSLEDFRSVFSRAEQSDFLTGRKSSKDHPGWVADLEFLLREESWAKICEGKYDNRGAPAANVPRGYASIMEAAQRRRGINPNDIRTDSSHRDGGYGGIPPDARQRDGPDRRSLVCGTGTSG